MFICCFFNFFFANFSFCRTNANTKVIGDGLILFVSVRSAFNSFIGVPLPQILDNKHTSFELLFSQRLVYPACLWFYITLRVKITPFFVVLFKRNLDFGIYYKNSRYSCVGGIMVSIAAFQAVDPGSIPGRRKLFRFL